MANTVKDPTRKEDLNKLEELAPKSYGHKQQIDKVYAQSKDHKLADMRSELVNAHKHADLAKMAQMERIIREHTYKQYGYGK